MSDDYLPPGDIGEQWCFAQDSEGYLCTRPEHHQGDHAAHGIDGRMHARWPR